MEQRRTHRYKLQLPIEIIQLGGKRVNRVEKTRDISSSGVCFVSPQDVEIGGRIEYLITLSFTNPLVRIRCLGKVLRSLKPAAATGDLEYEVAVSMERYQFVRVGDTEAAAASA